MKSLSTIALAATAVGLLAAGTARAQETDIEDLLGRLPPDCVVVAGSADAPKAFETLSQWVEPFAGLATEPEEQTEMLQVFRRLGGLFSGPALLGYSSRRGLCLVAPTEKTLDELHQLVRDLHPDFELQDDVIVLTHGDGYATVRDGLLAAASSRQGLDQLLTQPGPEAASVLESPDLAALLEMQEVREATLFGFKARWLPRISPESSGRYVWMALPARFAARVAKGVGLEAPMLLHVRVGRQDIRLRGSALLPPAEPHPAPPEAARALALPEECPHRNWSWGVDIAAAVDSVERVMTAFDPDVGAEFLEEMQELNADLGFDFQHDFLGNLGPGSASAVLPADGEEPGEMMLLCGVRDPEKFLRHAEALAKLAGEPWEEKEHVAGARHFSTRAFTHRLELAVRENTCLVASSPAGLQRGLELAARATRVQPDPRAVWETHGVIRIGEVVETALGEEVPTHIETLFLAALAEARWETHVARFADSLHLDMKVEGINPQALAEALSVPVREARGEARRHVCMGNLFDIGLAITIYRNDHEQYPATLVELYPQYLAPTATLVCSGDEGPMTITEDLKCTYSYVGLPAFPQHPARTIMAYEDAANHDGGRNALFVDMHCEWMTEEAFRARLEESLRLLQQEETWDDYTPERQKAVEAFYTIEAGE